MKIRFPILLGFLPLFPFPMQFLLPLLLLAVSSFLANPNPTSGDAVLELRALMEIKFSLDPENKYLSTWTPDGDPCSGNFEGVACNDNREVANISLQGKGLIGKLSPAMAELKCLSGLYLHYNYLSGEIPREIANLTQLSDLYLDVNNITGIIPPEIGSMVSLQGQALSFIAFEIESRDLQSFFFLFAVLQLCCNRLTGQIPTSLGLLDKLNVIAFERNQLTGEIPASLTNIESLNRLYLSFNQLTGPIPTGVADIPFLEVLDVQYNNLSGVIPSGLLRLKDRFHYGNNSGLCGSGFPSIRGCTVWDSSAIGPIDPSVANKTIYLPTTANFTKQPPPPIMSKSSSSRFPLVAIITGAILSSTFVVTTAVILLVLRIRRGSEQCDPEQEQEKVRTPLPHDRNSSWEDIPAPYKLNLEEVESATHHFSEMNLLGKSKFSGVYKGILKDGSVVAIKSINKMSCKTEEDEFINGLNLLKALNHENLAKLKGFCCSKDRGECFLIYEFAERGSLCKYLDRDEVVLGWPTRLSIIRGIAKGIEYLHREETEKPTIIHKNISAEKVVLDENWNPLILDSGLLKLLADDVVYSAIKVSAALGYMSPEYITTGKFTEKSDVYAFGVIVLQVLSGRKILSNPTRTAAVAGKWEELMDPALELNFQPNEAAKLAKIAIHCTNELPENRPTMTEVVEEL